MSSTGLLYCRGMMINGLHERRWHIGVESVEH